jgi:two-component system, cell cycle sensor histidine kinase and response regulator CckA
LSRLAHVCGWWHVCLWILGLLHLRHFYQTGMALANGSSAEERASSDRPAPSIAVTLLSLAATGMLALLVRALEPEWSQAILSGVMAGVYAASAAWFAARWWRTNQLGVFLLPVALELCALARLYAAVLAFHPPSGRLLIPFLYQNALLDFLLQTLTVVAMIVVLLRDEETLLRETGQRLAESEDRFRLLFERGGVGMALLSPDGDFVQVNPALLQMLGYSAAELVGRHLLDVMYEEDRSGSNLLRGKPDAPQYEREKRFLHRDGHLVWTRVVRVPIRDGQGVIRYHATFFVDISGHKRAEEALREQRRMEEQLNRARRMETLVTLVGGIAHDFNNLLTAILGNLDVLRLDLEQWQENGKTALESVRPCLLGIEQAARRCARMTARLLTFSRGRLGAMQTIPLDPLLRETVADLQRQFPRIQIEVHTPPGIHPVTVDTAQIRELLLNMAANAREAMPEGGTLTLSLANRAFTIEDCADNTDFRPGSFVELSVRDTGHGIAAEILDFIFDPFFTTKKPAQGAGMGLSVVFGIVRGHKGWITVDSQPGKGTDFRIYLPSARAPLPSAAPSVPTILAPTSGERILVVDDEPLVRDLAKSVLERMGFRVLTAEDGDEALDIYRREGAAIDLVLLDYIMPRMDGMQTLQELRQLNPNVRVLFCSGYHTDHEVDQLLAAGARGFVAKPYHAMELVQRIREVLGRREG